MVTPAHQFPFGVSLGPDRRAQLLHWARRGHVVIEDDYDAEFRYDRQPIGSLQGLAPEHVAYTGTVSKTLAPALRLGWMVLPQSLLDPVIELKRAVDGGSPTLDQLALAELIDNGTYERHLRRSRRLYRQRRDQLIAALHRHLPTARTSGAAAGLHLVVHLDTRRSATEIAEAAGAHGVALAPLTRYQLGATPTTDRSLVLGYANITASAIDSAIARLAKV